MSAYSHDTTAALIARRVSLDLVTLPPATVLAVELAAQLSVADEEIVRLEALTKAQAEELEQVRSEAAHAWEVTTFMSWQDKAEELENLED